MEIGSKLNQFLEFYDKRGLNDALSLAFRNRVLEIFCEELLKKRDISSSDRQSVERFIELSKRRLKSMLEILKSLEKHEIDYVLIKTFRPYFHVSVDLDILLLEEEFEKLKDLLLKCGFRSGALDKDLRYSEAAFEREEIRVDAYKSLYWQHYEALDAKSVRKRAKRARNFGVECTLPSPEDQILIISSHSINHNQFDVGELMWFEQLINEADLKKLWNIADENGLRKTLKLFVDMANHACQSLYGYRIVNEKASLLFHVNSKMTMVSKRCEKISNYPLPYPLLPSLLAYVQKILFNLKHGQRVFTPTKFLMFLVRRLMDAGGELFSIFGKT